MQEEKSSAKRIILILLIAVASIGILLWVLFASGLLIGKNDPKVVRVQNLEITLNGSFTESYDENYTAYYVSNDTHVFFNEDPFAEAEYPKDASVEEYITEVLLEHPDKRVKKGTTEDGIPYVEFSNYIEGENDTYSYFVAFYKTENAFWRVQFVCKEARYSALKAQFASWASTVTFR